MNFEGKRRRVKAHLKTAAAFVKDLSFDAVNSVHYWRHNLKGNRVEKRYLSGESSYPPVILLQGFMGTRGVLGPLENFLRDRGRDVISIDLGFFNVADIRSSAATLAEKIERLIERTGDHRAFEKIDIVGHSMGGLIGLYYIKHLGGHRLVNRMIGLGAPFHGTWVGLLAVVPFGAFSRGIWQMLPKSHFLKSLRAHPQEAHETKLISIAARFDALCPPRTCRLEGAKNLSVAVGHGGLLIDTRAFEAIEQNLSPKIPALDKND